MQRAMADLIWGAVPQRYPKLRFVLVEGGIGWVASVLRSMDHWWTDHHHWMEPKVNEAPSFYFKRQFWATFEDDRAGVLTRELIGVERLMWGSDYPHTEGTFPVVSSSRCSGCDGLVRHRAITGHVNELSRFSKVTRPSHRGERHCL
jgi:hypothetical protein